MAAATYETGKLLLKEQLQSGETRNGGMWYRQNIVVEIPGPEASVRYVKLEASGEELVTKLSRIKTGDEVDIRYFVRARKGSGKWEGVWFNDVVLLGIDTTLRQSMSAPSPIDTSRFDENGETKEGDLPF